MPAQRYVNATAVESRPTEVGYLEFSKLRIAKAMCDVASLRVLRPSVVPQRRRPQARWILEKSASETILSNVVVAPFESEGDTK